MKLKRFFPLFFLATLLLLNACDDTPIENAGPDEPDPITADLTIKVVASVGGYVMDEDGEPVVAATVSAGDKETVTDQYGYFHIDNSSLPQMAGHVKVTKNGFFEGHKTFLPEKGKDTFMRLQLMERKEIGAVSATAGGTATLDGGRITLPADGVVIAGSNASYTGQVHINARLITTTSEENDLSLILPGDARGTNKDGYLRALKTFSTVAVELTGDGGQLLQLKEGKPASISLPIPSALVADAPATVSLWSLDTATGLWKEEGTATKSGDTYMGTVTHFSFWEGAEGLALVNFSAHIVDEANQPLVNVPVSINIAGLPKNAGHGRFGYTDANGNINGAVFANANLVLDVLTTCAISAYSHDFTTTTSDIDLGTLTGNLGQNTVTLTGTVTDCNNQPVTDGYVQTYDNGFYNRIAITNGSFSFTGLSCTNASVNIVAVDNNSSLQNAPKTVTLQAGLNNLGALSSCGQLTYGKITYTYDGVTTVMEEPAESFAAYFTGTSTQVLTLSGDPNLGQKMSFQFTGAAETGTVHKVTDVWCTSFPSGRGYWPVPITVTVTGFDPIGGFVTGSFSSTMLDFTDNSLHTLSVTFKVKRKS